MNIINQFSEILIKNNQVVSEMEFTKNNYDDNGILITESLPTITTEFCEIGLHKNEVYFVFIIESKSFSPIFFSLIKDYNNVKIYGFVDFNKILYPGQSFNLADFAVIIKQDKFLQIEFDYQNQEIFNLYQDYLNLVDIFTKSKVAIINQLEVNLKN